MTFGTFYFLEVVNFVESKSKKIQIGVRWKDKSGEEEVYPYIPKGLLRLNVSGKHNVMAV